MVQGVSELSLTWLLITMSKKDGQTLKRHHQLSPLLPPTLARDSWSADSKGPGVTVSPNPEGVGVGLPTFPSHRELLTRAPTHV